MYVPSASSLGGGAGELSEVEYVSKKGNDNKNIMYLCARRRHLVVDLKEQIKCIRLNLKIVVMLYLHFSRNRLSKMCWCTSSSLLSSESCPEIKDM
jgi:hypothetical protein